MACAAVATAPAKGITTEAAIFAASALAFSCGLSSRMARRGEIAGVERSGTSGNSGRDGSGTMRWRNTAGTMDCVSEFELWVESPAMESFAESSLCFSELGSEGMEKREVGAAIPFPEGAGDAAVILRGVRENCTGRAARSAQAAGPSRGASVAELQFARSCFCT